MYVILKASGRAGEGCADIWRFVGCGSCRHVEEAQTLGELPRPLRITVRARPVPRFLPRPCSVQLLLGHKFVNGKRNGLLAMKYEPINIHHSCRMRSLSMHIHPPSEGKPYVTQNGYLSYTTILLYRFLLAAHRFTMTSLTLYSFSASVKPDAMASSKTGGGGTSTYTSTRLLVTCDNTLTTL